MQLNLAAPLLALCLSGCVTNIAPQTEQNPPPQRPLSGYAQYVLVPTAKAESLGKVNEAAFRKVEESIQQNIGQLVEEWNRSTSSADNNNTLVIQPTVTALKFVDGGTRAFAGAAAGSSAVLMRVRIAEQNTDTEIANPEFFQRAAAVGGAWSFGGTDNHMLARISQVIAEYLKNNYSNAVGGSTSGGVSSKNGR